MRIFLRALAGASVVAAWAFPSAAQADQVIEAVTVWRFDAMSYTIDQGEPVVFQNSDAASPGPHDVTSEDKGPDGRPVFASKTIPAGQESPVDGAARLGPGSYGFLCTVHPFMTATLEVTARGAPVAPAPPAPQQQQEPADTRAPSVTASVSKTSLKRAVSRRRVTAVISTDEPSSLSLRLAAKIGRRTFDGGTATGTTDSSGRATVVFRLKGATLRALRKARRATLSVAVEARDSAGNLGTARAKRRVAR